MAERAWPFARKCLFSPAAAARAAREPGALRAASLIYAAFLAGYWAFFTFKPFDFPEQTAPAPRELMDAAYWLKVVLWQPPLEAAWIAFLIGMAVFFERGALAVRTAVGVAWWAAFVILVVAYAQLHGLSKPVFALGTLAALVPFYPLIRRSPPEKNTAILAFMVGTNAIGVALFAPMAAAVLLASPRLYYAAQIGGGFWILGVGTDRKSVV